MDGFWGKFLRYRFDFAAMAFDCVATFLRPGRALGRVGALFGALLLVFAPVYVLAAGNDRFGNHWAFGLTLVLFVVVLEAPGHLWRRGVTNGGSEADSRLFDHFLFSLLTLMTIAAPLLLITTEIRSTVALGIVWGVAVIGAQDLVRTGIASFLTLARGHPVYVL